MLYIIILFLIKNFVCVYTHTHTHIWLPTKVHVVKAMVFPVMCSCESWTIKKAEHQRIDVFWVSVLEKTLKSLLDIKEMSLISSQS